MMIEPHSPSTYNPANQLFSGLIWPAAAGNVVWAFFTLTVYEQGWWLEEGAWARLLAIGGLGAYLCGDWLRLLKDWNSHKPTRLRYFAFDALHLTTIVVFVLAVQFWAWDAFWIMLSLASIFAVTVAGHLGSVWETEKRPSGPLISRKQWELAGCNAVGLGVSGVYLLTDFTDFLYPWHLPAAVFGVLIFWRVVRRRHK